MADEEELPPKEGEEGEVVVAADPVGEPVPNPIEALASEMGWRPKEQYEGDPEKWKPADQFIKDGRDIQRTTARELREIRETVGRMASTHSQLMDQQLRERDEFWKAKQQEAWEANDKPTFEQASAIREQIAKAAPQGPPPEVDSWVKRNAWFTADPVAHNFAVQVCELNKNLPYGQQLELAEKEVRKRFPEHFPAPAKAPAQVAASTTRAAPSRGNGKTFNDLPREAQEAAKRFEAERGVPKERYTELYFKNQEQRA